MKNLLKWIIGNIRMAIIVMLLLAWLVAFLKIVVVPLSGLTTMLFVLFFTIMSFQARSSAIFATGGLLMYLASWFALDAYGPFVASFVCSIGIFTWFTGFYKTVVAIHKAATSPSDM